MRNLPFRTETFLDGKGKTMTSNIWTLSEAIMVAEEQFIFLGKKVYIIDSEDKIVLGVSTARKKITYRDYY